MTIAARHLPAAAEGPRARARAREATAPEPDDAAIAGVLVDLVSKMDAPHVGFLALALRPGVRKHIRDELIRTALRSHYPRTLRTVAAKAMFDDMEAMESIAGADPKMVADLTRIMLLNGGRSLGWRQLSDIASGWRGWT